MGLLTHSPSRYGPEAMRRIDVPDEVLTTMAASVTLSDLSATMSRKRAMEGSGSRDLHRTRKLIDDEAHDEDDDCATTICAEDGSHDGWVPIDSTKETLAAEITLRLAIDMPWLDIQQAQSLLCNWPRQVTCIRSIVSFSGVPCLTVPQAFTNRSD